MMEKKAQLNISFGWLFAIIVGATILVLVIFGVTKMIKSSGAEQTAIGAKELGVLLNPLETGFEAAISTPLSVTGETKIYNNCHTSGNFGKQGIQLSEIILKEWTDKSVEVPFKNKYIFSNSTVEGKNFYIFSKPFEFPFKVADLIYLTSAEEKYCFTGNVPEAIEEEITQIGQANLAPNCSELEYEDYIKVCFEHGTGCDIKVISNYVEKRGEDENIYFVGDTLMYAAIFSDNDIYECQVTRLLMRTKELANLYKEKSLLMNCDSGLEGDLGQLSVIEISGSSNLRNINNQVEIIKNKNDNSRCKLW